MGSHLVSSVAAQARLEEIRPIHLEGRRGLRFESPVSRSTTYMRSRLSWTNNVPFPSSRTLLFFGLFSSIALVSSHSALTLLFSSRRVQSCSQRQSLHRRR